MLRICAFLFACLTAFSFWRSRLCLIFVACRFNCKCFWRFSYAFSILLHSSQVWIAHSTFFALIISTLFYAICDTCCCFRFNALIVLAMLFPWNRKLLRQGIFFIFLCLVHPMAFQAFIMPDYAFIPASCVLLGYPAKGMCAGCPSFNCPFCWGVCIIWSCRTAPSYIFLGVAVKFTAPDADIC